MQNQLDSFIDSVSFEIIIFQRMVDTLERETDRMHCVCSWETLIQKSIYVFNMYDHQYN